MLGGAISRRSMGYKRVLHSTTAPVQRFLSTTTTSPRHHGLSSTPQTATLLMARTRSSAQIRSLSYASASASIPESDHAGPSSMPSPEIPEDMLLQPVSGYLDFMIHPLADAFISLPHPLGYGASIVILTVFLRTTLTLPIRLWQKKRAQMLQDVVVPQIAAANDTIAKSLATEYRKKGIEYSQYIIEVRSQVKAVKKALHKKYRVQPFITNWAPLLVHIPIFVTLSLTIRRAMDLPGSPVAADSFLWLDRLGEVDGLGILPIFGMMVAFGNAEMMGRRVKQIREASGDKMPEESRTKQTEPEVTTRPPKANPNAPASPIVARSQQVTRSIKSPSPSSVSSETSRTLTTSALISAAAPRPIKRWQPTPLAKNKTGDLIDVGPGDKPPSAIVAGQARLAGIAQNLLPQALRCGAIVFAMFGTWMPSGVVLYWTTSICYSFVQNVVLNELPRWRADRAIKKEPI